MILVLNFNEIAPINSVEINTTSRSLNWSKGLSPFYLTGGRTWTGDWAENVENMWQYSKVYKEHITDNEPNEKYFEWAKQGWSKKRADRYPMSKGSIPEYSLWNNEKLNYLDAKEYLYIPMYYRSVIRTQAFRTLKVIYDVSLLDNKHLILRDFDAYNHHKLNLSYKEVIRNPNKRFGHAFVLAMMLENKLQKNSDNKLRLIEDENKCSE